MQTFSARQPQKLQVKRQGYALCLGLLVFIIFVLQSKHLFNATSAPGSALRFDQALSSSLGSTNDRVSETDDYDLQDWSNQKLSIQKKRPIKPRPWIGPAGVSSVSSAGESLASFLQSRLGTPNPDVPVWLVEADAAYLRTAVPHLRTFLARLEQQDLPPATSKVYSQGIWADQVHTLLQDGMAGTGPQDMVVLCLDSEDCPRICQEQGILCYTNYYDDMEKDGRPESIKPFVWVKLKALVDIAKAGYPALWADGDVFFRNNPFEFILPMRPTQEMDLTGKSQPDWDFQVTDEEADNAVNIGFFLQRASQGVADVWQEVLDKLVRQEGWWDQLVFNQVLDIGPRRRPDKDGDRRKSDIVGLNDVKVHILDKERFRGYMLGFLVPPEAIFIHMPCADNAVYKDYIAATYGYFQDAPSGYYSSPPKLITTPSIAGTEDEVIRRMRLLLAAAKTTGRAFVPPMECSVLIDGRLHTRHFSSVFRIDDLRAVNNVSILEPNYPAHAAEHLLHNPSLALQMSQSKDLDMRNDLRTFQDFMDRLQSPIYQDTRIISISQGVARSGSLDKWELPLETASVDTCANIAAGPSCTRMCERKQH